MEQIKKVLMPLEIQKFAEGGEEARANSAADENAAVKTETGKETKSLEKKYDDDELNAISLKNTNKALEKQLKDLGIDDVEEAKQVLKEARDKKEASKTADEKTQEITRERDKAKIDAINVRIENAFLRKSVDSEKAERLSRLVDKEKILDKDGNVDSSKLTSEVEEIIKLFPELFSTKEEEKKGFKIGGDGKEDKKNDLSAVSMAFGNNK